MMLGELMYCGAHAASRSAQPAIVMASDGEIITYGELEARTNRLAHLFRAQGLRRLDHYAIFMENNARYVECCGAGERAGLYYTCVNSFLTPNELAYIVDNCQARVLIVSESKRADALAALPSCPRVELCLVVNGEGAGSRVRNLDEATASFPTTPIADEVLGGSMLYSSGTTGRPKGVLRPLEELPPSEMTAVWKFLRGLWHLDGEVTFLSPAPLYHAAPSASVALTIRAGGTAIIMDRFDPEHYLALVEKYKVTHSQLVPTMFSRMLKLPEAARRRYDLSSLKVAIHAAAPCPIKVKEQMIDWWGPKLLEYYGMTEAIGFAACDSLEWLAHKGTVGKVAMGKLHVLDENGSPCPQGQPGALWFEAGATFEYFNDPEKTAESRSADGALRTVGDIGYLDQDGYLYLTDRTTFMIISGGVNIYPQECENVLVTHPKVADAAVFGVPNEDLGEEVKAVVQLMPGIEPSSDTVDELLAFCAAQLARQKCPRSFDFVPELPRLPTGKLYKRHLREKYWGDRQS
jgi:long-chain acyl-CoA synthetase